MERHVGIADIVNRLKTIGIEAPSIMPVSAIRGYENIYFLRQAQGKLSGFEPEFENFEKLIDYLKPWKTLIGMAIPYALLPKIRSTQANQISRLSIMSWEWDYHDVIKSLMKNALSDDVPYVLHVDSGPLPERSLALQMGIAKAGRSQMLIHDRYGTAFHLAFVLVDIPYEEAVMPEFEPLGFELAKSCHNCRKCQSHCPSKALTGDFDFDGSKCISALTQVKGLLSEKDMVQLGRQLYGCDHCQLACPVNSPLFKAVPEEGLLLTRDTANAMDPTSFLFLSQKAFKRLYGQMGFSWRGVKTTKRNALINMANSGDASYIKIINEYLLKQAALDGEDLEKTALWAMKTLSK